jgi:hypothetical protein
MQTIEFEIGGQKYRAAKLDTFKQLHVSRKVGPVLPKLLPVFVQFTKSAKDGAPADDLTAVAAAVEPLTQALADMPDVDFEYVVNTCLAVVQRNQMNNWAPVYSAGGGLMFDDIDLGATVQLVAKVIWYSLGPFLSGFLANAQPTNPTA